MKQTLPILWLVALYCSVQGASIGNVDVLKPLVTSVTNKISDLLKRVDSEKEVTNIIENSEEIRNAAEVVIAKTSDMMEDGNVENVVKDDDDDDKNVDIMRFIAENAISNDDIVKVLFSEDQLEEDDLRAAMLMNSLGISGEGLKSALTGFTSASGEQDKRQELNNVKVWCQAIVKISGALESVVDDAEMTLRTQLGVFGDEQQAPSDGEEEKPDLPPAGEKIPELPPAGEDKHDSNEHQRHRRAFWTSGNRRWRISRGGVSYTRGRHRIYATPTFNGGRVGVQVRYRYRIG